MKNFLIVLTFLALSNVFGQDKKYAVYVDIFPMMNGIFSGGAGLGIGYDYALGQNFSIGMYDNYYGNFDDKFAYNIVMVGKYYPLKAKIGNLLLDAGLGYRRRKVEEDNIHCLAGQMHAGWKFIFNNGLILEPSTGFRYDIATFSGREDFKFGFNIKAIIGMEF